MSDVIFRSNAMTTPCWCIERQPEGVTDPMVVSFRKWNGKRSLLNQNARWTGDGWDPTRWQPTMPSVPPRIRLQVEQYMQLLQEQA